VHCRTAGTKLVTCDLPSRKENQQQILFLLTYDLELQKNRKKREMWVDGVLSSKKLLFERTELCVL